MSRKFYRYPPRPSSGAGTFSDNIVGLQLVTGGGLTQGNFEFTTSIVEKVNRTFNIGAFSEPISLDTLKISNIQESKSIIARDFRVYPNFDLSEITRFSLYGSLSKRISTSIEKIINFFPAALEVYSINGDFTTGYTAENCVYDNVENITTFKINVEKLNNPFEIDYSVNATRNISLKEIEISSLRNLTKENLKYSLFINDNEYNFLHYIPSNSLYSGYIEILVNGNPFSGLTAVTDTLVIKPNSFYTDKSFIEPFDEVEKFLLNRLIVPKYTATFQVPKESDSGGIYVDFDKVTWPIDGVWNLDIRTPSFDFYLEKLNDISDSFDNFRTNLITRFLTTDSFKEFDTEDQRVQKILSIYGRSFDEVKKFIDALAYMNSVNYTVKNDIPSQLLKNLSETIGWKVNVSPITNENFLESVFGNDSKIQFPGYSRAQTPTELNYQFYRNLILNSAYLFKSKGTRKSIEFLLRLVGAPDALVEFNENIYIAGQKINMSNFDSQYAQISMGTYTEEDTYYDGSIFRILGNNYSGFSTEDITIDVDVSLEDYPVDRDGYPKAPTPNENYFFQKGARWFELVKDHQSLQTVNNGNSVFTGQNTNIQTEFEPFSYGQKYLDRFRYFPYMKEGFKLVRTIDNKKSWPITDVGLRIGNGDANYDSYYFIENEKLILNVKNVDLFLNPAQGLVYDVWYMSRKYDYPIPNTGLTTPYPQPGGVDWTFINPQPSKKSFFEFAQTFWLNTINVRNRLVSSDGKTSGYPTLQSIYWNYLLSQQKVGIPNDNFNYQSMIDYVNGLGDYWIRLVEQMIPATTIWQGGVKFENSIFNRQKFVYRLQRGCQIVPVPCIPCEINADIFPYLCVDKTISCCIYPWQCNENSTVTSFSDILYKTALSYLTTQIGISNANQCLNNNSNTLVTNWSLVLKGDNDVLIDVYFYTGYGLYQVPTETNWLTVLENNLPSLINYGLNYFFNGNTLYVSNADCEGNISYNKLQLEVGLNFTINCN